MHNLSITGYDAPLINIFREYLFLSRLYEFYLSIKYLEIWDNSVYCEIFIYIHKNLFARKLAESLLYNFQSRRHFAKIEDKKVIAKN